MLSTTITTPSAFVKPQAPRTRVKARADSTMAPPTTRVPPRNPEGARRRDRCAPTRCRGLSSALGDDDDARDGVRCVNDAMRMREGCEMISIAAKRVDAGERDD